MKYIAFLNVIFLFFSMLLGCVDSLNSSKTPDEPNAPLPKPDPFAPGPIEKKRDSKALAPVGIVNSGNDCYFITAIQFLMNNQSFLNAALEAGKKQPLYTELVTDYQKSQRENKVVESKEGSAFRNFKRYLQKKYGMRPDGVQDDAAKSIGVIIKDVMSYGPTSPFESLVINEKTKHVRAWPYLPYAGVDGKDLDGSDFGKEMADGLFMGTDQKFLGIPNNFMFQANLSPSEKIFSFELPKEMLKNPAQEKIVYKLGYLAIHAGTISYGHYFAWLKVNETWYEANDSSITPIGDDAALHIKFSTELLSGNGFTIMALQFDRVK